MTFDGLVRPAGTSTGCVPSNGGADHLRAHDLAEEVRQLQAALLTNRRIGAAIGILMHDPDVDEARAFAILRRISQNSNRKLRDVALDVTQQRGLPLGR